MIPGLTELLERMTKLEAKMPPVGLLDRALGYHGNQRFVIMEWTWESVDSPVSLTYRGEDQSDREVDWLTARILRNHPILSDETEHFKEFDYLVWDRKYNVFYIAKDHDAVMELESAQANAVLDARRFRDELKELRKAQWDLLNWLDQEAFPAKA